ncbi:MAG: repeat containing protein [Herbinix sp.]|jgi:glucose/arabinose dehydrogenase|nr:repeat containing protein [Herbinix sp.]
MNNHKFDGEGHFHQQSFNETLRILNPDNIILQAGYTIEVFLEGLNAPSRLTFTDNGDILIALSGYVSREAAILRYSNGQIDTIADGFLPPITGLTYHEGNIYVTHANKVTIIYQDGRRQVLIDGLPILGDYWGSNVAFGPDGKMYLGIGSATNSGVVGTDNVWIFNYPFFCDQIGHYAILVGDNFETANVFTITDENAYTGAFSPFGIPNRPFEIRKGIVKASGSIIKSNADGSQIEQFATGFRYPNCLKFDINGKLYVSQQTCEARGSRPIANAPNDFCLVTAGTWYGWPDYVGNEPVTLEKYKPEGGKQPEFLLHNHPMVPPRPFVTFPPNSKLSGFAFNYNTQFGPYGNAYIAEYGAGGFIIPGTATPFTGDGYRVSEIDMNVGAVRTFAINRSGFPDSIVREGGFGRPADIAFGPDGAMYVLDIGISSPTDLSDYYPNTGVIWRITRE